MRDVNKQGGGKSGSAQHRRLFSPIEQHRNPPPPQTRRPSTRASAQHPQPAGRTGHPERLPAPRARTHPKQPAELRAAARVVRSGAQRRTGGQRRVSDLSSCFSPGAIRPTAARQRWRQSSRPIPGEPGLTLQSLRSREAENAAGSCAEVGLFLEPRIFTRSVSLLYQPFLLLAALLRTPQQRLHRCQRCLHHAVTNCHPPQCRQPFAEEPPFLYQNSPQTSPALKASAGSAGALLLAERRSQRKGETKDIFFFGVVLRRPSEIPEIAASCSLVRQYLANPHLNKPSLSPAVRAAWWSSPRVKKSNWNTVL